jgi:hypothetical protein
MRNFTNISRTISLNLSNFTYDILREGIIFGPSGKSSKLDKMDKLIVCLALELAIR